MAKEKQTSENSSGSRLRRDVSKIFDCFLIVNHPPDSGSSNYMYPPNFDDQEIIQQSVLFCFPFDVTPATLCSFKNRDNRFTFILTDIEGKHRFGFCKLTDGGLKCYCILSFLPWFEIFYKLLNYVHELSSHSNEHTLEAMLTELFEGSVPDVRQTMRISESLSFQAPDPDHLPSIPGSRNLSEYYRAVNPGFMMDVFASLMFERRIIFTSKNLNILTSSIHSAEALLRPLHWQHIFIPVMPEHLLDYCLAPMPFLIGIHSSLMTKVRKMVAVDDDVIIADIDRREIESAHDDMGIFPNDKISFLKSLLRKSDVSMGTNLSMAFLRTQARLIGGYRNGLKFLKEEAIVFDEDTFIDFYKSNTAKRFARELVQLQTFKQFVDGRLDMLNAGVGFQDPFENEVNMVDAAREGDRDRYKEWLSAAKKGGNKFFTQVHRKAKDTQQSIKNYLKEQQKLQSQKKIQGDSPKSIRSAAPPPRPPSISQERLKEIRSQRQKPPARPPPPLFLQAHGPLPQPPARKKTGHHEKRYTRRYNTLDLDDVAPPVGQSESESGRPSEEGSDISRDTPKVELIGDKKMHDLTPTSEPQPDLLLDLPDPANEHHPSGPDGLRTKVASTIDLHESGKPGPPVTSARPDQATMTSSAEVKIVDAANNHLIDFSSPSPNTEGSCNGGTSSSSASDDLIGLDFSSPSIKQPILPAKSWAEWKNDEKPTSHIPPPRPQNPFMIHSSPTKQPTNTSARPVIPARPPNLFHASNASPSRGSLASTATNVTSEGQNSFPVTATPTVQNSGYFASSSAVNKSSSPFHSAQPLIKPSSNQFNNNHVRAHHTMSHHSSNNPFFQTSKETSSNNPFSVGKSKSGVWKNQNTSALPSNRPATRGGSLRQQPRSSDDSELFSDLLGSWKTKDNH